MHATVLCLFYSVPLCTPIACKPIQVFVQYYFLYFNPLAILFIRFRGVDLMMMINLHQQHWYRVLYSTCILLIYSEYLSYTHLCWFLLGIRIHLIS
ncbi:hypothetical protein Leryth_024951 [Lithospermum erythrorhizon]|nr:hypothetical protein Leryth_024951 [Lithospermum erythrorhizon]